jgi:4-amino-4-deoxy-L-arabinose transferase-like glycosyltransferase
MQLEQPSFLSRKTLFKWFLFILAAKLLWLLLFTALRNPQWNPILSVGTIGLYGGDTQTYYYPLEQLIASGEYYGMCRMPGVLPIYLPLRMILSEVNAQQAIVVLQVIFDSISTLLLAILAARLFGNRKAFHATILLSCVTTFIALRNLY